MNRSIFRDVSEFEAKLGLPHGFYDRLLKEDDWSFVIKLSSLFEGACTHVLSARLNRPELDDAFANIDMANSKFGKIVMLKALGAINPEQFNILKALVEHRNKLIHNISNVSFSFDAFIESIDKNKLKSIITLFGHGLQENLSISGKTVTKEKFVRQNLKLSIWLTAAEILACLYLDLEVAQLHLERQALDAYSKLSRLPAASSGLLE